MQRTVDVQLPARWHRLFLEWTRSPSASHAGAFRWWPRLMERLERPAGETGLLCLSAMPVRLFAHQQRAVARVVGELAVRALLADEVGMGKTIEAGAVLKELLLRGRLRRALVLVPAALLRQWQLELRRRCDIRACVHPHPQHGWDREEVVLASLEAARREPHASAIAAVAWDVVVVDEAHRLKNRRSAGFRLVAGLRKRGLLLLTATPVHNTLDELHNLVSLLRPGQLGTPRLFRSEFTSGPRTPRNPQRLRQILGEVMVRTRRHEAGIALPPRSVRTVAVPFDEPGRSLYERLLALLRGLAGEAGSGPGGLLAATLLREATSSPAALAGTLRRLCLSPPGEAWERLQPRLTELARMADRLAEEDPGPKARWLGQHLRQAPVPPGSVVAFTQFASTAVVVVRHLKACGVHAALVCGRQDNRQRQRELRRFRQDVSVLVSTDVGSEGQNLQHAWQLVNLDLPWNPMRVEQRIGRLHRLGQTRTVEVWHLLVPATIEEYLMELIYEKLGMFREVIGDLDEVVASVPGGLEGRIREIVLTSRDEREMRRRLEEVGGFLERQWLRWQRARSLTAAVLDGPGPQQAGAPALPGPVPEAAALQGAAAAALAGPG